MKLILPLLLLALLTSCSKMKMQTFPPTDPAVTWQGRTLKDDQGNRFLVGSASYLRFKFTGSSCKIHLSNLAAGDDYNYISYVVDGEHSKRIKIDFDSLMPLEIIAKKEASSHTLELYKETEAKNGAVVIGPIDAYGLETYPETFAGKIEFIGNSISAGMSSDISDIPCEHGKWYDQHNAYDAFGPTVARTLHCDYVVAAVSGMGMYRNWNTDSPVMKDVYESIMLSADPASPRLNYKSFSPDVMVLCVGANDLSDGDGVNPRLPFDSPQFIQTYISFLENLHQHHPEASFLLLNSPVNPTAKDVMLQACLTSIQQHAPKKIAGLKPIQLHFFPLITPKGCGDHPDVAQQKEMAKGLEPVLKKLLEL